RLRNQNGLRGQFEYGLRVSGRYADDMKAVLRSQGLPDDLLAMVFVESLFYMSATSHAGASGPWGFVKETALNSGINVNKFADERLDPVMSTWAAARYINKAKAGLSEWPLIITSYNYGYAGTKRAVTNLGTTDFSVILDNHDSPLLGYASKNYYAEFLAARDIMLNQKKHFPELEKELAWKYRTVEVLRPVAATDLFQFEAISKDTFIKLNPSLTKYTVAGHEVIPPNYVLRVPHGKSGYFYQQIKKIPQQKRNAASYKISSKYVAKGRESLSWIAKLFGVSSSFLSEKMGKPIEYRPKGPVLIRSQSHLFAPLLEINQSMLSALAPNKAKK
ncbi:MAG TPA: transglycosylase SLT domain-containing protein, partial [Myxococcota bacterium]|nr:transglycosylase SLT domain-containing protein [Myxococcota bacterium]